MDGYRYRIPSQAVEQLDGIEALRGEDLRQSALDRFSLEAVAPKFDEWLWRLSTLRDDSGGWYTKKYWAPVSALASPTKE